MKAEKSGYLDSAYGEMKPEDHESLLKVESTIQLKLIPKDETDRIRKRPGS